MKKILLSAFLLCAFHLSINAQCYPDRHNTSLNSSWISCSASANPNSARGTGYWMLFELEEKKTISSIQLWNLNHPDHLRSGVGKVAIDYLQGNGTWRHHSDHNVEMATASGFYEGENLNLTAEFVTDRVLLTFTENHGGNCYGLAEIRIGTKAATTTSLELVEANYFNMQVAPNPFSNVAKVQVGNLSGGVFQYQLVNQLGQVVLYEEASSQGGTAEFNIFSKNLSQGVYYLKIINDDKVASQKIFYQE